MQLFGALTCIHEEEGISVGDRYTDDIDAVLQKYAAVVYRIAYARTKNASDAKNVMQDYLSVKRPLPAMNIARSGLMSFSE